MVGIDVVGMIDVRFNFEGPTWDAIRDDRKSAKSLLPQPPLFSTLLHSGRYGLTYHSAVLFLHLSLFVSVILYALPFTVDLQAFFLVREVGMLSCTYITFNCSKSSRIIRSIIPEG